MGQNYVKNTILIFSFISVLLPKVGLSQDTAQIFNEIRNGLVHIGMKNTKNGVGSIEVEKWLGTGFAVDDVCTFATAKHVIKSVDPSSIIIRFQIPTDSTKVRTVSARILYEDAKKDISFLKIDKFNNKPCKSRSLYRFKLSGNHTSSIAGETIIIAGYPKITKEDLDIPIVRKGIIASAEIKDGENMLLLDLTGVPGFSGSPVVLEKTQEVIGIVYGPGPTKRAFGFEWATPITMNDYENAINTNSEP